jgi:hypothetical protein
VFFGIIYKGFRIGAEWSRRGAEGKGKPKKWGILVFI